MTVRAASAGALSAASEDSNAARHTSRERRSLLDIEELATWLGIEVGFVRRLIAQRRIPFVKIGKFVRFDPNEIEAWIDGQRIPPESGRPSDGWKVRVDTASFRPTVLRYGE